jgi:hypothetical protein
VFLFLLPLLGADGIRVTTRLYLENSGNYGFDSIFRRVFEHLFAKGKLLGLKILHLISF